MVIPFFDIFYAIVKGELWRRFVADLGYSRHKRSKEVFFSFYESRINWRSTQDFPQFFLPGRCNRFFVRFTNSKWSPVLGLLNFLHNNFHKLKRRRCQSLSSTIPLDVKSCPLTKKFLYCNFEFLKKKTHTGD